MVAPQNHTEAGLSCMFQKGATKMGTDYKGFLCWEVKLDELLMTMSTFSWF